MLRMKMLSTVALAVALAAGMAWAGGGAGGGGAQGAGGGGQGGGGGPGGRGRGAAVPAGLGQAMQDMGRMLQALSTNNAAADFTNTQPTLRNIAQFERDVAICKMQNPPTVAGEDAAKSAASFRSKMQIVMRTLVDLEDHVNDKKADDVKKDLTKLTDTMKEGHTEFHVGG